MEIPEIFYAEFRGKTRCLAAATGLMLSSVIGFFLSAIISSVFQVNALLAFIPVLIAGGSIGVLLNQIVLRKYFLGKMRGAFELLYKESLYDYQVDPQIYNSERRSPDLDIDSAFVYRQLMARAEKAGSDDNFWCYMAAAKAATVGGEDTKAIFALKLAISLRPLDFVANYRLARQFERLGSGQEAVNAYEKSLQDPAIASEDTLKQFIREQVIRIKEYGPRKSPPVPGFILQFM